MLEYSLTHSWLYLTVRAVCGPVWQTYSVFFLIQVPDLSTAESWGPAPAAWVPIQWLTTAQKIPFWRGDGSRSGPSPCKARRDITPLSSLVTSFIIKSDSIPALWAGFSVVGIGWILGFCSGFVGQNFGCCNYLHDRGPAHRDGRY